MRTLVFVGMCGGLSVVACIRDPGGATEATDAESATPDARRPSIDGPPAIDATQAADRGATPRDVGRPDADARDGAAPEAAEVFADARTVDQPAPMMADAGPLDAAAPDMLAPDIGRWPIEAYCPPLDCATLPTWEGPEGLACEPAAGGLTCPLPTLVCPGDLMQLRRPEMGCIAFRDCHGARHGPECDGQTYCDSCVSERTGEVQSDEVDTECCFQGPRVNFVHDWVAQRVSNAWYDEAGRQTAWQSEWLGGHDRDWTGVGECRYDPGGRLVGYHMVEAETGGNEGRQHDGCAVYNAAGQLTGKTTFDADGGFGAMLEAARCISSPSDACDVRTECDQPGSWLDLLEPCFGDLDYND